MVTQPKLSEFKVTSLPVTLEPDAIYYVKGSSDAAVTVYVTNSSGTAFPLSSSGGGAVDSVNGQTGAVVLDNEDVGAAATSHTHVATAIADSSAIGRTVLTAADAAAIRTAIGVGSGAGDMVASNNLSDVASPSTSLANLGGVSTAALAASGGSALVGFMPAGAGAVASTVQAKLRAMVSLEDFGVVAGLAVSDAVAEANVTYAQAALDYAGITGQAVYAGGQYYVFKDNGLRLPSGVHIVGNGTGYWEPVYPQNDKGWYGTNFIFKGASGATTKYTMRGITSMRYAGGRREDPENAGEYFDLTSLMNADASGTTPATPKQLSVAITGKNDAVNWGLHGVRVVPWLGTDGVSDYSNQSNTALSHPWDIGILIDDHEGVDISHCQGVGHWRVFGGAICSPGFDDWGHIERNSIRHCRFQGVTGFAIRASDRWAVSARTSSTVTIRWSEESYWPTSGSFLGVSGNGTYTYSGTTRVGDNLRFDGVSPDPTIAAITEVRSVKAGSGAAGSHLEDVYCYGLEHEGGGDSESLGLPISKAFEVSGWPLRGLQAYNLKTHTPNERVIAFLHDVQDFLAFGWQVESYQAHIIASPATTDANPTTAPAPIGVSQNIRVYAGVGFVDAKNTLWTPRTQFRDSDQIAVRDEVENALLFRALSGQDTTFELATGKKFIIRNDDETALFDMDESTGVVALLGGLAGSSYLRAGTSNPIYWHLRSQFLSPADGQINARNYANNAYATLGVATPTSAEHAATKAYVDRGFYVLAAGAPRISHTGNTSETALVTVVLPAAAMGANGVLRMTAQWKVTNNANVKTPRIRLGGTGGTAFLSGSLTTSVSTRSQIQIHNVNSQSSQVSNTAAPAGAFVSTANSEMTGTIDTSVAQDIVFTGQLANSADSITLESYLIEIFYQA